ncbi:hypothetical protein [Candidatus Laterigemmans baculatus]|uniref:hypothetical protein n=1 Tax=Candidatus Laterigemmans baculatus TaxID=2770505 RepID=UPI0013DD34A0|nr:hypothetical protein [Candidatus Laterigemmans baculatus]
MLSISPTYLLYYLPLLVAISIVYGGTRHEDMGAILRQALHTAYWVTGFMGIIFLILMVIGWWV